MKVIQAGHEKTEDWTRAVVNTCDICGCRYQLEEGDECRVVETSRGGSAVISNCPGCKESVTTHRYLS